MEPFFFFFFGETKYMEPGLKCSKWKAVICLFSDIYGPNIDSSVKSFIG